MRRLVLVLALLEIILNTIFRGKAGFFGGLLGSSTVVIFFGIQLLVAKLSLNLEPIAAMGLAMFSYFAKVLLLGALLIVVSRTTSPETVSRTSFAICAISITLAWLGAEIRTFLKLRLILPLPTQD